MCRSIFLSVSIQKKPVVTARVASIPMETLGEAESRAIAAALTSIDKLLGSPIGCGARYLSSPCRYYVNS